MSPFLDTITLARVARDLGIHGKVIPKVIKGRQYVAFSGRAGLRNIIRGTFYLSRNAKIINLAIGAMGVTKMAAKGGVITICITVPLSILECYFRDRTAWYQLAGQIGTDLIKIGIASLLGAISGIALTGGSAFLACPPIGAAIGISVFVGLVLEYLDARYKLTEKLIEFLRDMPTEADKAFTATGQGAWNVLRSGGFGMGNWLYTKY